MVGLPLASAVSRSIEFFSSEANEGAPCPDLVARNPATPSTTAAPASKPLRSGGLAFSEVEASGVDGSEEDSALV